MTPSATPPTRATRHLLALTAAVLALHWLVLQSVPWSGPVAPVVPPVLSFSTRNIEAPPPQPPTAAPEPVRQEAAPRPPKARSRPSPPPQAPASQATPQDEAAPAEVAAPSPPEAPEAVASAGTQTESAASPSPAEPPQPGSTTLAEAAPQSMAAPNAAAHNAAPTKTHPGSDAAPPPVRLPPSTRLAFDVAGQASRFNYRASAELLWQHEGARYSAHQEIRAFLVGSRSQNSVGQITPLGLQPERFADRVRSEQAAHFDYDKGIVIFSANTPQVPVARGAQDRLSVFIQLSALLAAAPARYPPGTQITLYTVGARAANEWTFRIDGEETLELPIGATPTRKLERLPRGEYDQKAELWLAPALGYLPARIRLTQANGDFADLQLKSSNPP